MEIDFYKIKDIEVSKLVKYYLCSCYLYYEKDLNIFTDSEFDYICKRLYKDFSKINHMHKKLIDKDSLKASTGYQIKYPLIIETVANRWYEKYIKKKEIK